MTLVKRFSSPITVESPKSASAEEYDIIRTNIQFAGDSEDDVKVILVTSAQPREGKTSTATNIAVVAAHAGKRVLLIDADMRNPNIHKRFQISNLEGLSTVLIHGKMLSECIIACPKTENLYILTSGPSCSNVSKLLSSRQFAKVISHCRDAYDFVVIDSPPVLVVSDSLVLTRRVDATILVVDAQKSNRHMVLKAVRGLDQVNAKILGIILNRVRGESLNYYRQSEEG